jgi:hypothetical protein
MAFLITQTPTRAFRRLERGETVVETYAELAALQERLQCDIYVKLPDEYGQRRVFLYDP